MSNRTLPPGHGRLAAQRPAVTADPQGGAAPDVREEDRRRARGELGRWRYRVPYSVARVLGEMRDERRPPMQAVVQWLRMNCRGGWRHVAVPGGEGFFCMDDADCARLFMARFGKLSTSRDCRTA